MVFDAGSITAFFEKPVQMGLSACTLAVAVKGIIAPDDLLEFTKDGLETVFRNLCKPPKTLTIPLNAGMPVAGHLGILTEVQPYVVSAKSKIQLL